jgi:hypothetical protein
MEYVNDKQIELYENRPAGHKVFNCIEYYMVGSGFFIIQTRN